MESAAVDHFTRGQELALAGDLTAAEIEYRAALTSDPGSMPARLALATLFLGTGRAGAAEPEFRAALDAGVTSALAGLALCLRARGALAEARALLEKALGGQRDDPLARELLATLPPPGAAAAITATALSFDYREERLVFRCERCGCAWEQAIASPMCVLEVACSACDSRARLEPEDVLATIVRLRPPLAVPDADTVDRAAALLTATWHTHPELTAALEVAGMNVGELAEHPLMAIVLDALLATRDGGM